MSIKVEKIENISEQADGREKINLRTEYSQEEMNQFNSEHIHNAIEMRQILNEIKELNKKKKSIADDNNKIVDKAQLGFMQEYVECYYIDDLDDGIRRFYNDSGIKVHERRLEPEEKVFKLPFAKAVNN